MSTADIGLYLGKLLAAWSLGFTGGYLLTKFSDALNKIV